MEINKEILRWVILIGAMPIWLPFLITLWKDFNDALREDGGLLGSPPDAKELERIRKERGEKADLLVNEPIIQASDHRRPRLAVASRKTPSAAAPPPGFRGR